MATVECGCGKKFEVEQDGRGCEEIRQHWREEQKLITGGQWIAAADWIERSKPKTERK